MSEVDVVITPAPPVVVEVTEEGAPPVEVALAPPASVVEVEVPGPAGPRGEMGPPGTDLHYVHQQDSPSAEWTVAHNLRKFPSATVVDTSGRAVLGEVAHMDENSLVLRFSAPFSGMAYLN